MSAAVADRRRVLYRAFLVAAITCTALLTLAAGLSVLGSFDLKIGGLAVVFLVLLGGGYLLPAGGLIFGALAVFLGQRSSDRGIAAAVVVACIAVTTLLYALASKFLEL